MPQREPHEGDDAPVLPFFVVGIGVSAGGLEALEELFRETPPGGGLSYVVVQHLSPDFRSMMVELLARHTRLPVLEIEDGTSPQQNAVHLLGPKHVVVLEDGLFKLVERDHQRLAFPINLFLTSLAEHQGDQCAAVILSGTGSDGTHGARMVKEAGGVVLAQDPSSARFDGMPNSVIATGLVDFVASPRALAARLVQCATQPAAGEIEVAARPEPEREAYGSILKLLRNHSRIDFTAYRNGTLSRRIQRRAAITGQESLVSYASVLEGNATEVELLTREVLIGVTQFFRDPEVWSCLSETIIPELVDQADERNGLRLWCAGCATGEEAYTLAMLIEETLARQHRTLDYRLFATDVRRDSLRFARAGTYPLAACGGIPEALRERYFDVRGEHLVARRSLRDMITFAPHDVLRDAPFTQLNLVSCRNLLIYLLPETQRRVLAQFRLGLREGGCLVLGASESVGESSNQFRTVHGRLNLFRARGPVSGISALARPLRDHSVPEREERRPKRAARDSESLFEAAIHAYAPPGVAIDGNFDLLQVFGSVSEYVSLPAGRMTTNLLKMVPRPLAVLLSAAVRRALGQGEEVRIPEVRLAAEREPFTVRVVPVDDVQGETRPLLVFFEGVAAPATGVYLDAGNLDTAAHQRLKELEDEIMVARENLHTAVQDLESTNEELQAANEELTSTNEELQSTNEELQSVNEELYTVNSEYQEKIAELEQLNTDLENLLHVVDAGVLFLDPDLSIRRFNDAATRLLPLRFEDIGRPLHGIAIQADYATFVPDAQRVSATAERHFVTVRGHDGAWWSVGMRVFVSPGGPAAGVIVTMQDISELKRTIAVLEGSKHEHERAEGLFGVGHAVLDLERETVQYSQGARILLGLPELTKDAALAEALREPTENEQRIMREGKRALSAGEKVPITMVNDVELPDGRQIRLQMTIDVNRDLPRAGQLFVVFQPVPER